MRAAFRISVESDISSGEPYKVILHSGDGSDLPIPAMSPAHARKVAYAVAMLLRRRNFESCIIVDSQVLGSGSGDATPKRPHA